MDQTRIYTVGGTVGEGVYIQRKADEELFAACLQGDFSYILTARQLGKSSLMVNTANRLAQQGVAPVMIDLTAMGRSLTPEQWFLGLIDTCIERLGIEVDYLTWWNQRQHLGYTQRLIQFFEAILLKEVTQPVVVFIDEIDTTLSFSYKDDFFAGIRSIYNARGQTPVFQRLTFVLIGVATPDELIQDTSRTPFNIGRQIELTYFTPEEALPLASGLNVPVEQAQKVLNWILDWTSGHPYLTQKLCSLVSSQTPPIRKSTVDRVVREAFFSHQGEAENNLQFIKKTLLVTRPDLRRTLAAKYNAMLLKKPVSLDDHSDEIAYLKLTGIIRKNQHGYLVSNRIYANIFNQEWVLENLLDAGAVTAVSGSLLDRIDQFSQRAQSAIEQALEEQRFEEQILANGLAAYARSLQAQLKSTSEETHPYRGLLPYGLGDSGEFFGRDQAIQDLVRLVRHNPLSVLHSEAGAGKTSLMEAGLASRLIANGALVLYFRPYNENPTLTIKQAFLPASRTGVFAAASLKEFLRQLQALLGMDSPIYIFLDQFEEFFLYLSREERSRFLGELAECLNDRALQVRWLLAVRGEYLSALAEMEAHDIQPYQNTYRLNQLSLEEARQAIVAPAEKWGWSVDSELVDAILADLETNDDVDPTQLQLVCAALAETLRDGKTSLSLYQYLQAGSAEGILRNYLNRLIDQRPSEDRKNIRSILSRLISSDGRRAIRSLSAIQTELASANVSIEQTRLEILLDWLVSNRLVVRHEDLEGEASYELAQDDLVEEIELQPEEQARKAVQELLDQETRTYQVYNSLLAEERFLAIQPFEESLVFSPAARDLFARSKLAIGKKRSRVRKRRNLLLIIAFTLAGIMTLLGGWAMNAQYIMTGFALDAMSAANTAEAALGLSEERGTLAAKEAILAQEARATAIAANANLIQEQATAEAARRSILELAADARASLLAVQSQIYLNAKPDLAYLLAVEAFAAAENYQSRTNLMGVLQQSPFWVKWHILIEAGIAGMVFRPQDGSLLTLTTGNEMVAWGSMQGQELSRTALALPDRNLIEVGFIDRLDAVLIVSRSQVALWNQRGERLPNPAELDVIRSVEIIDVAFSQNCAYVAFLTSPGIYVWSVADATITRYGSAFEQPSEIALSGDGRKLAVAGSFQVVFWEPGVDTQGVGGLIWEGNNPLELDFSPDAGLLAVRMSQGDVQVWDTSPGGDQLAASLADGRSVYIKEPSRLWKRLDLPGDEATALNWSDSNLLAVGYRSGQVLIQDGNTARTIPPAASDVPVEKLVWSPEGFELAVLGSGNALTLYKEFPAGSDLRRELRINDAYFGSLTDLFIDQEKLIVVDDLVVFHLLDLTEFFSAGIDTVLPKPNTLLAPGIDLYPFVYSIAISTGIHTIAILKPYEPVYLWHYLDYDPAFPFIPISESDEFPTYLRTDDLIPDDQGRGSESSPGIFLIIKPGEKIPPEEFAFSPTGEFFALGYSDGCIDILDLVQDKTYPCVATQADSISSLAWSPDGSFLASGSYSGEVFIWRIPPNTLGTLPQAPDLPGSQADLSGVLAGTAAPTGAPTVNPPELSLELIQQIVHGDSIAELAFSPDGQYLASASLDNTIKIVDLYSWNVKTLVGHTDGVLAIAWFPDGRHLASGGEDRMVLIWDQETGQPIGLPMVGHQEHVTGVAITGDGSYLFSAGLDGKIFAWEMAVQRWLEAACARAGRNFSQYEWDQFFPGENYRITCADLPPGK